MDMIKTMLQEKYDSRYNKSGKQAHQSPQDQHQLSGTKKQLKSKVRILNCTSTTTKYVDIKCRQLEMYNVGV